MELKIIATYNQQHILTGITQVPKDAQLIDGQTDILPKIENDNYFTGTGWIHKEIPTATENMLMKQQGQIAMLQAVNKQMQKMVMGQQAQIMSLQKEGN